MADPHAGGIIARGGAPLARARLAAIMLHGRGGSAEDMLELAEHLAIADVAYLAPEAAGHSWWPQSFLAPLAANEKAAKQAIADKLEGTGTVTPQDLDALVQQESQARTALLRERLAAALDVRSVLTPDQIQKAATIRAGVKDLRAQMRQLFGKQGAD